MKTSTRLILKTAAVLSVAVVSLSIGSVAGAAILDAGSGDQSASTYSTNGAGQTYGSALQAKSVDDMPQLVEAIGDDGKTVGYVKRGDLVGPEPTSPEEALRIQSLRDQDRTHNLYASDGKTIIGTFTMARAAEK